jgi:hypothetical protein
VGLGASIVDVTPGVAGPDCPGTGEEIARVWVGDVVGIASEGKLSDCPAT